MREGFKAPPARSGAVVIGGSAGSVEVLLTLLPALPAEYPDPIIVVIHLPPDSDSLMPELLMDRCRLHIKEAEDKEVIEAGTIYLAPSGYHLLVERGGYFSLSVDDPVLYSRPALDPLFQSAADTYRDRLIGIVLTGASADGAAGLNYLCNAGGTAIVQDPATARCTAMPEAAIASCPRAHILAPDAILRFLLTNELHLP